MHLTGKIDDARSQEHISLSVFSIYCISNHIERRPKIKNSQFYHKYGIDDSNCLMNHFQYQTSTTLFSTYTKMMLNKWLKNKTNMNYADEIKEK